MCTVKRRTKIKKRAIHPNIFNLQKFRHLYLILNNFGFQKVRYKSKPPSLHSIRIRRASDLLANPLISYFFIFDKTIIFRILHRSKDHPIQAYSSGRFIDLIFISAPLGNFYKNIKSFFFH